MTVKDGGDVAEVTNRGQRNAVGSRLRVFVCERGRAARISTAELVSGDRRCSCVRRRLRSSKSTVKDCGDVARYPIARTKCSQVNVKSVRVGCKGVGARIETAEMVKVTQTVCVARQ